MINYSVSQIDDHANDLVNKITALVPDKGTFRVYDPEATMDLGKDLSPPYAAIAYGGMRPVQDGHRQNRAQTLRFYVYILAGKSAKSLDIVSVEGDAIEVSVNQFLDSVKQAIVGTDAPSKHKWAFEGESPYDFGDCGVGYVQIWETNGTI